MTTDAVTIVIAGEPVAKGRPCAAKKTQLAELRYPIVGEEAEELLDQLYPERDVIAYDEACDEKL